MQSGKKAVHRPCSQSTPHTVYASFLKLVHIVKQIFLTMKITLLVTILFFSFLLEFGDAGSFQLLGSIST